MAAMTFIEKYFKDEGISLGRHEEKFDTARRMRDAGMPVADIQKFTTLSLEDLRTL